MRMVVGLVPLIWARTRMTPLAVWVRPGTFVSAPMLVSTLLTTEVAWTATLPLVPRRSLMRYSLVALTRRAMPYTYWLAADGGLVGRDRERQVDVERADAAEDGGAVGAGGHEQGAGAAGHVEVGGGAREGVGAAGRRCAAPRVDHRPGEEVVGVDRHAGGLGDRPGEGVGVGEAAVADGQHDGVAAGVVPRGCPRRRRCWS